jgi:hypothetical protein
MTLPFVLKKRIELPSEPEPTDDETYDSSRQIWIDSVSGRPLVVTRHSQASRFGETTITETREGVDQAESSVVVASRFGETSFTKTQEGVDQTEGCDIEEV